MQNQECLQKCGLRSGAVGEKMDGEAQCVVDLLIFIIFVNGTGLGRGGAVNEVSRLLGLCYVACLL